MQRSGIGALTSRVSEMRVGIWAAGGGLAAAGERNSVRAVSFSSGRVGVREEAAGHLAAGVRVLPVHTPILRLAGEPKSQKRPLCGSQGSRSVHSSPSCLAQTRQQPQPSSTRLTPAGQRGACSAGHRHGPLQFWPTAGCGEDQAVSGAGSARTPSPAGPESLPGSRRPQRELLALTRLQKARKSTKATRTGPTPAAVMVGAAGGTEGAVAASG